MDVRADTEPHDGEEIQCHLPRGLRGKHVTAVVLHERKPGKERALIAGVAVEPPVGLSLAGATASGRGTMSISCPEQHFGSFPLFAHQDNRKQQGARQPRT